MKVSRIRAAAVLAAVVASGLVGCAAERVSGLKAAAAATVSGVQAAAPSCRFSVKAIDDKRDQADLGTVHTTRVGGEGFAQWFADGIAVMPGYSREAAPVELRIEVVKAYIQSLGTLKSANLVVKVQVAGNGAVPGSKVYRGVDGSVNWSSSESEIQAAFDAAMTSLRQQLAADQAGWCKA
ncbi:hypothetical protein [Piscinibacter terrae]|uniref:Lipoprotein n=1 Tax=Piscinibacter terrae TaxID=2496871 RepID=A0A3N7J2Q8_9BURK|nr:hypothetical protein [Albitalea terrae]RQP25222.1 hypothetical protein DZC73_10315 [Albitalea terrae]